MNPLKIRKMKKKIILFATAIATLASCSTDEFIGDKTLAEANNNAPITFNSGASAITRADKTGGDAATDLNGQFYVWGIKKEATDGVAAASSGNLVYKNYVVKWVDNSANTTTSNTQGWEYVGYTLSAAEIENVKTNSGNAAQTIKYWDYGANDYTFYAFSALPDDITAGNVKVTKTESVTSSKTVYDKGYTATLTAAANLDKLFFAERVNVTASNNTDRTQDNKYGGNVTFKFHNVTSKVRVGMYETIPGYKVTINKFSVDNDGENPAFSAMTDDVTANFAANLQYSGTGAAGSMTVTYVSSGTNENYPIVSFTPTSGSTSKVLALGTNLKVNTDLGTDAASPTYDKTGDDNYTRVFPNESNTQNLKLKLSYTLTAPVTGETITITDATAEIPAKYLQWKAGYAYTYLFKISDNTNGQSGQGVTGLYPITFDAVEVLAANGTAEYITTVSEPSITTYAKGSAVTTNGEYKSGETIYAVVEDASAMPTLTADNMKLYTVTTTDGTNFPITEASVAEALIEAPTLTKAQADAAKIKCVASSFTYGKTVVDEAGNTVQMDASNNVVASFTTAANTVYAIQYIKTAATYTNDGGKNDYTSETFTAAGTLYSNSECTNVASSWSSGTTYYKRTGVETQGTYAYKIVKVKAD